MSADPLRKAYRYTCNMVRPQIYSEKSLMESVVDFFSDVVPQAVSGAPKCEDKEKIQWVRFENCDCNDVAKNPDLFRTDTKGLPLLLILGYSNGVQIWHVTLNGEAQEVLSLRQGPVRICRVLPNPEPVMGTVDSFASKRPLIVMCDSSSAGQPYCGVKFVSLKTGDEVHSVSFKTLPVQNIECNRRFIVLVFLEKVCVHEACNFKQLFWVTSCYPCPGPTLNPIALSTRWLAYADKRLVAMHQSCGGMSGDGSQSYAATVLSAAKGAFKGLSMFGEAMVNSMTGCKTTQPRRECVQSENGNRPGIVSVIDIQNIHNDHFNVNEDNDGDGLIAHFHAHANEPVSNMAFDPTGILLVTACKLGHNFHVFRLMAHPVSSSVGAVHHLYTLHRGETTAKVIDISFTIDSRWVTVSSHRGTTHLFPITPYGGPVNVRTHCQQHVVNRASRFHRSAGIDEFEHVGRRSPVLSSSPSSSGHYDRYPTLIQQNTLNNNMGNPRLPPYPHPTTIEPAYQIKQPLNVALNPAIKNQSPSHSTSGVDNVYSVCARFCTPRLYMVGSPKLDMERREAGNRPVDSLFVMAQSGTLVEYVLEPKARAGAEKVTDECALELNVVGRMQWNLQRLKNSLEIRPPLPANSPLILAHEAVVSQIPTAPDLNDLHGLTRQDSKESLSSDHSNKDENDEQWVAHVEIRNHASPHRRLWMGPQFSFKTYQENTTVLSSNSSALLSQSPESNIVAMDMAGDECDLESLKLQPTRSNPVSMPNARPAYRRLSGSDSSPSPGHSMGIQGGHLLIEAGSFDQSPHLLDVYSNWAESTVAKQPRGSEDLEEDRLKETLADAMAESPIKDIEKLSFRQDIPRSGDLREPTDGKTHSPVKTTTKPVTRPIPKASPRKSQGGTNSGPISLSVKIVGEKTEVERVDKPAEKISDTSGNIEKTMEKSPKLIGSDKTSDKFAKVTDSDKTGVKTARVIDFDKISEESAKLIGSDKTSAKSAKVIDSDKTSDKSAEVTDAHKKDSDSKTVTDSKDKEGSRKKSESPETDKARNDKAETVPEPKKSSSETDSNSRKKKKSKSPESSNSKKQTNGACKSSSIEKGSRKPNENAEPKTPKMDSKSSRKSPEHQPVKNENKAKVQDDNDTNMSIDDEIVKKNENVVSELVLEHAANETESNLNAGDHYLIVESVHELNVVANIPQSELGDKPLDLSSSDQSPFEMVDVVVETQNEPIIETDEAAGNQFVEASGKKGKKNKKKGKRQESKVAESMNVNASNSERVVEKLVTEVTEQESLSIAVEKNDEREVTEQSVTEDISQKTDEENDLSVQAIDNNDECENEKETTKETLQAVSETMVGDTISKSATSQNESNNRCKNEAEEQTIKIVQEEIVESKDDVENENEDQFSEVTNMKSKKGNKEQGDSPAETKVTTMKIELSSKKTEVGTNKKSEAEITEVIKADADDLQTTENDDIPIEEQSIQKIVDNVDDQTKESDINDSALDTKDEIEEQNEVKNEKDKPNVGNSEIDQEDKISNTLTTNLEDDEESSPTGKLIKEAIAEISDYSDILEVISKRKKKRNLMEDSVYGELSESPTPNPSVDAYVYDPSSEVEDGIGIEGKRSLQSDSETIEILAEPVSETVDEANTNDETESLLKPDNEPGISIEATDETKTDLNKSDDIEIVKEEVEELDNVTIEKDLEVAENTDDEIETLSLPEEVKEEKNEIEDFPSLTTENQSMPKDEGGFVVKKKKNKKKKKKSESKDDVASDGKVEVKKDSSEESINLKQATKEVKDTKANEDKKIPVQTDSKESMLSDDSIFKGRRGRYLPELSDSLENTDNFEEARDDGKSFDSEGDSRYETADDDGSAWERAGTSASVSKSNSESDFGRIGTPSVSEAESLEKVVDDSSEVDSELSKLTLVSKSGTEDVTNAAGGEVKEPEKVPEVAEGTVFKLRGATSLLAESFSGSSRSSLEKEATSSGQSSDQKSETKVKNKKKKKKSRK